MTAGWEGFPPKIGMSIEGKPLTLKGVVYPHGVGTHARSDMVVLTNGAVQKFVAMVGVDDEKPDRGSVVFQVLADGKRVASSGRIRGGANPLLVLTDSLLQARTIDRLNRPPHTRAAGALDHHPSAH